MGYKGYLKMSWKVHVDKWHRTGSNYICNPPVEDTDIDYICYTTNAANLRKIEAQGFVLDGVDYTDNPHQEFWSYKKGYINLIITDDLAFYNRFVEATEEAKRLNLTNKKDRIELFQNKLYNKYTIEDFSVPF